MVFRKLFRFSGFKLGLLITLLFCWLKVSLFLVPAFAGSHFGGVFRSIENTWSDLKFRLNEVQDKQAFRRDAHVVIVAIDEKSLRMPELGMWPWPRAEVAKMVRQLGKCGARVIGFDAIFAEPDSSRAAPVVESIRKRYERCDQQDEAFRAELENIQARVEGDRMFAEVLEQVEGVVLGYFFFRTPQEIEHLDPEDIREGKERIGFGTVAYTKRAPGIDLLDVFPAALGVRANLPILTEAAELYGYFNVVPDADGIYRKVPLIFVFSEDLHERRGRGSGTGRSAPDEDTLARVDPFPALSLQVLSAYYSQPVELYVHTTGGEDIVEGYVGLFIGPIEPPGEEHIWIPVEKMPGGPNGLFRVRYYGPQKTFRHVSAGDIIRGEPEACAAVKDKIVLFGSTAIAVYDLRPTPFEANFPGVEIHATIVENVIRRDFMLRPMDLPVLELLYMLLVGIVFSWLLSRYRFTAGAILTVITLVGMLALDALVLFPGGWMVHPMVPVIHLMFLLVGIAIYRYMTEERQKREIRHAFQFYLSGNVIDTMLQDTSKLKLGGERRELTVLFSDIRGFTTISEGLAPEQLTELLNEYLTPMTEIVFKYNGTLDKYMGDAIMALFGAPVAFEDHPRAACRAALDMMEELGRLQEDWRRRGLPEIDIGIGVNTGPMSVGNMGSANRFDYTVMGDHVNLGSRLEGLNKQYGTHIIISEFTREAIGDHFTCRELDAVRVKGKLEPVRIFELLHWGPPLVEQDAWIERFHQALAHYKERRWDRALAGFEALPDDAVSRMYIERCREMQGNPPGPDWDGVFKMTTK